MLLNNNRKSLNKDMSFRFINRNTLDDSCFFLFDLNNIGNISVNKMLNKLLALFGYENFFHSSRLSFNFRKFNLFPSDIFLFFFPQHKFLTILNKLISLTYIDNVIGLAMNNQFFNVSNVLDFLKLDMFAFFSVFSFIYNELAIRFLDLSKLLIIGIKNLKC